MAGESDLSRIKDKYEVPLQRELVDNPPAATPIPDFEAEQPLAEDESNWDGWVINPKPRKPKRRKQPEPKIALTLATRSISKSLWAECISIDTLDLEEPQDENAINASNDACLLYHAKVAVTADRYLMKDLRKLALGKLHFHLSELKVDAASDDIDLEAKLNAIFNLLQYVYSEEDIEGVPELREIVVTYVAAKLDVAREDHDFLSC